MSHYHDDSCACGECVEDMQNWGHRRMRDADASITFTLDEVSDELMALLFGMTPEEINEMRRPR